MASYSLEIKRSAVKELADLPAKDRGRIVSRIQGLAENPYPPGAEKLSGQARYRLRQGDYRILYEIHEQVLRIVVVKIARRLDVYRR